LPHEYYNFIAVFARASPHDKEVIVKYFKENGGIVYAGDGTNDVGGLRVADVGVAVVGTTTISETEKKEQERKREEIEYNKKLVDLKNDLTIPFSKKYQMLNQMTQERIKRKQA
jgi:magnesium-transporting ATPase (P-type)